MVITPYGIVATSYVQASQAGAEILAQGGSAIDAGIAANAVFRVARPMTNGVGGDLFAIYWEAKTGKLYGINSSGWAPKALTIDHLPQPKVTQACRSSASTPSPSPAPWTAWPKLHKRFGQPALGPTLFQPAIFYASGTATQSRKSSTSYWQEAAARTRSTNPESTRVFLPGRQGA